MGKGLSYRRVSTYNVETKRDINCGYLLKDRHRVAFVPGLTRLKDGLEERFLRNLLSYIELSECSFRSLSSCAALKERARYGSVL
jgi:hypothetical protein